MESEYEGLESGNWVLRVAGRKKSGRESRRSLGGRDGELVLHRERKIRNPGEGRPWEGD